MTTHIEINFINSINGSSYGKISIDPSDYPILNINLLKKQIRKIVEYDICIFLYDLIIIQTSDDLYPFVVQNCININITYDTIKKSQRLKRIHDGYMYYMQRMNEYAKREYCIISNMTIDELEEHYKKTCRRFETLLFNHYDEKRIDSIISIYLSSTLNKKRKVVDTELTNLNSILYLSLKDIEHYDRHRLSRDDFREYYAKN